MTENKYRELLLGCGHRREKLIEVVDYPGNPVVLLARKVNEFSWQNLVCLDSNPNVGQINDFFLLCDLNKFAAGVWNIQNACKVNNIAEVEEIVETRMFHMFLKDDIFDEVHAYEVVEHLGQQGDAAAFFSFFSEVWRVLKPGGLFFATCPSRYSPWLWGDPSHTRVISRESLIFLEQSEYARQLDGPPETRTPMSDFRNIYKADFKILYSVDDKSTHRFVLKALK